MERYASLHRWPMTGVTIQSRLKKNSTEDNRDEGSELHANHRNRRLRTETTSTALPRQPQLGGIGASCADNGTFAPQPAVPMVIPDDMLTKW